MRIECQTPKMILRNIRLMTGDREVKTMISSFIPVIGVILVSVLWIIPEYKWLKEEPGVVYDIFGLC